MNVKVEVRSQESWRRVLAIEVPAEDAAQEYDRVARKFAQEVRLPGFRKGKVPSAVVRKSFKGEVDREFLEEIVPKAFGTNSLRCCRDWILGTRTAPAR